MSDLVPVDSAKSLLSFLDTASSSLESAKTDFERLCIRDTAAAVKAAALILGKRDVQVQASILIQRAEREVAKANPSKGVGGDRRSDDFTVLPKDAEINDSTLRNIRQAHGALTDKDFQDMVETAVEKQEPLSRKTLLDASRKVREEQRREERDEKLSAEATSLLDGQEYAVLYADPPWRYEFSKSDSREIENQYPTMTLEEIKALDVPSICHEDAVLYLWATSPKLLDALEVMEAWGFTYRSQAVWVKDKIGMGYWWRNQHEILLVGVKGNFPPPVSDMRVSSVHNAPRFEHSEKPVYFAQQIERWYPDMAKIELFSRSPRVGWTAWGNQA